MSGYGTATNDTHPRLSDAEMMANLRKENAKLRELAHLLLWGVDNDMPRDEELVWSQKVDALVGELGIEVTE